MPREPILETPEALGERYWRDLLELVEQGEISPARARRIGSDMFETSGGLRRLRLSFWRAHVREATADFSSTPSNRPDGPSDS
jgi:hypothetical protein